MLKPEIRQLFMIGHSNLPWAFFKRHLLDHGITTLIDVRSNARSRHPQFNGAALRSQLSPIAYVHEPRLGGRNPLPSAALRKELERVLATLPARGRICLMCSEGDYRDCHRHTLLAPAARELGWRVMEIGRGGSLVEDQAAVIPHAADAQPDPVQMPLFECPHCGEALPQQFVNVVVESLAAATKRGRGQPKVLRPCPFGCGVSLGARELREHAPQCPLKARKAVKSTS